MGFGLMIAGFILLFNPVINVFDVLPDAIGFLLIAAGLSKMAYFVDSIAAARKMFLNLVYVELAKIAALYIVIVSPVSESGTMKALFSFCFGIAEALMFAYAMIKLFDGLSFSGIKYGSSRLFEKQGKNSKKKTDRASAVRNYMIFFYSFRCAATLIPELVELESYDHIGNVSAFSRPLAYYKPALYVFFNLIVVILSLIYIVKTCRYFRFISKDEVLVRSFAERYEEALRTRPTLFLSRRMMNALALFAIASLTSFTLLIDDVNLLIGAFSAVFFAASAMVMHKYVPRSLVVLPFAVLRAVSAIASFVMQIDYFNDYSTAAVEWVDKAAEMYDRMAAVSAVDHALALVLLIVYLCELMKAVRSHIAECGVIAETVQYSKADRDKELHRTLKAKLITDLVLGAVYFVSCGAYRYIVLSHPEYIAVNSVLAVVFIAYTVYTIGTVNNLLYGKETEMA